MFMLMATIKSFLVKYKLAALGSCLGGFEICTICMTRVNEQRFTRWVRLKKIK